MKHTLLALALMGMTWGDAGQALASATVSAQDGLSSGRLSFTLASVSPRARDAVASPVKAAPLPPAAPVTAAASDSARFDLVVNNAPAAQVFLQIGAGSGYTMLVPPDVAGNVSQS